MVAFATTGTEIVGGLAGQALGQQGYRAVVAIARAVAHPGHALRTDGVEIPLMDREVGAAIATGRRPLLTGAAAGRAAHNGRLVEFGLANLQDLATETVEAVTHFSTGGIELSLARWTGNELSHRSRILQQPTGLLSRIAQPDVLVNG
jgi:hypothetical protein